MIKDYLTDYKKGVQAKFEEEKNGANSSIFINPSRARLRKLCIEIFKSNSNPDDLKCFASFFGFEFNPVNTNKLKDNTDKFRPIETFLKGETDLADIEGVNLAAILVDFKCRPYLKYSKKDSDEVVKEIEAAAEKSIEVKKEENRVEVLSPQTIIRQPVKQTDYKRDNFNFINWMNEGKSRLIGTMLALALSVFAITKYAIDNKECMQWQENHFETVYCETKPGDPTDNPKIPIGEELLDFRKITVTDTTTFFKNGKPIVWYFKSGDELECFNEPGVHPLNGKTLKPITDHMIDKYIYKQ